MKTLDEIVSAVRSNELCTAEELTYAVVAFDVLLAQLELDQNAVQLQHWMAAATQDPRLYAGEANDPANPETVAWYRAMHNAGVFACSDGGCVNPNDSEADHTYCAPF